MDYAILVPILWFLCGFIQAGISIADFQRSFPNIAVETYRNDVGLAIMLGLLGPVGLCISFLTSGFCKHGWSLRRYVPKDEV